MTKKIQALLSLSCALVLCVFAAPVSAQVDRATLSGVVRDASGAAVAGATVTLTHVASGRTLRVAASGEGAYQAVSLPSGEYQVDAEAGGFQPGRERVVLQVAQRARLDLTLSLEARTEEVTVEARTLLASEQAALGTVIDQTAISKLPLAIRNWDDLLVLVAGVQGDRYTEESGGTASGRTGGVYVHGNRSLQNNFLLDGVDNNTISTNVQELSTQVARPSIDTIQEFKVVTSPYSAEYGRAPGAAISVTTKSGTNRIRGTVYEFYRNDRFDSNTFFAERAGAAKPSNDQNQFGANVGGPLVKDRAFFFFDYEGTRIKKGVTRLTRVPTLAERQGVFTSAVRDPLTGQPFPGNAIPASRIDPVAARVFALLPAPNQEGTNNFFRQPDVEDDADRFTGRLDLKLSESDNVFARYIYANRDRFIPGYFGGQIDGTGTSAWGRQNLKSHGLVLGWTRVASPTVVNEFRFSWSRAHSDAVQEPFGENGPDLIGLRGVPDDARINGGIAGIVIDGYFGGGGGGRIGSPDFLPKFQRTDQFEFIDTVSWLKGDHQLKLGFDVIAPMKNQYLDVPGTRGTLTFRNAFTGNAVADFLLGYVFGAQLTNVYVVDQRHWAASVFVQDDWKPSRRVTVNLGLRYDFITPALEAENRQTNFDPATASLVFAGDGSLEERGLVKPDKNNLAPRVGVVFQADDATILRAGYGVFYNLFDRIGSEDQLALNPPGLINNSVQVSGGAAPLFLMRDGFPAGFLDPSALDLRRVRLRAVAQDAPKTTIHQFSLGVQRQLLESLVVSVDGVAALGRNLANLRNLNQPAGGSGPLPYPGFGPIEWREQEAESSYKGIDLTVERRFRGGYGFGVAYTLGKSEDTSGEHLATPASFPQDATNLEAWRGPSDYDIRHRLVAHLVTEWRGFVLSGIWTYRSGRPFTVTQSSNNVGQLATGLPDRVGDGGGQETVDSWFDPTAFRAVPSGTFGNSGRNILRGPDWKTLDLSLQKRFRLGGELGATLRWDVFNVFDRANFGIPDANIASRTVGTISSLAGDPRTMQFSARVEF
jgi:hypothetical protein